MIKQVSSTGYLRKRLPQELMVSAGRPSQPVPRGHVHAAEAPGSSPRSGDGRARNRRDAAIGRPSQGEDAGVRRGRMWGLWELYLGSQWHMYEMQHLWGEPAGVVKTEFGALGLFQEIGLAAPCAPPTLTFRATGN